MMRISKLVRVAMLTKREHLHHMDTLRGLCVVLGNDSSTSAENIAEHTGYTLAGVLGSLEWLQKQGLVCSLSTVIEGRSHFHPTPAGLVLFGKYLGGV